jgi:hypothetical protein
VAGHLLPAHEALDEAMARDQPLDFLQVVRQAIELGGGRLHGRNAPGCAWSGKFRG